MRDIVAGNAKAPDKPGVFFAVLLHQLDATEEALKRKEQELDSRAIRMPN